MEQGMVDDLSGEARERRQRRRFWLVLGTIALVSAPVGGIVGFKVGGNGLDLPGAVDSLAPGLLILFALLYALSILVGTVLFTRVIDEVELADNLWASAVGFYFYGLVFPCWWLLAKAGLLPAVNDWLLFVMTYFAGVAGYFWRKWRQR